LNKGLIDEALADASVSVGPLGTEKAAARHGSRLFS
jgi:hypothetical protein